MKYAITISAVPDSGDCVPAFQVYLGGSVAAGVTHAARAGGLSENEVVAIMLKAASLEVRGIPWQRLPGAS